MFDEQYGDVWNKNEKWNHIKTSEGELYDWDPDSTYIQEPPFLTNLATTPGPIQPIRSARCLGAFGDSVTTDHISPAGSIAKDSPAGKYLISLGVEPRDFNSYGARRGNDRVMTRGTFANIRIRNLLAPGTEGGVTRYLPPLPPGEGRGEGAAQDTVVAGALSTVAGDGRGKGDPQVMSIYDAAMKYKAEGTPTVVLAGAEYGSGSSRDWAAKGPFLQGVRAVIASSFERIHRSNLVMMGILPLEFAPNVTWQSVGLNGEEVFDFPTLDDKLQPRQKLKVVATKPTGERVEFEATVRIDTPVELDYYRNGGILQTVLRKLLKS
jgi:aconitate hydratase